MKDTTLKSLSVCIIGKPNAGKSTLLNRIIKQKISIVTPKVQTTRSIITGIITLDDTQLILFDTPGIFAPKRKLEKAMVRCAWSSLNTADIVVLVIDSSMKIDAMMQQIIERISTCGKQITFLLNKIDILSKFYVENMLFLQKTCSSARMFNISALNGKGVDDFITYLKDMALDHGWLYEKDDITNLPARFLATEITREQLFLKLHEELPYNLTVESESWIEQKNGTVKINQAIIVGKEMHKNMVIGKNGKKIKDIGTVARINIEKLLGQKVHLFLFVKVRENWEENPGLYYNLGLD